MAIIDWGKDRGELPSKVLTSNLILNSNRHLELASKKKATTLVSQQTLEVAIQEATELADQLMSSNAHDKRLDKLQDVVSFLSEILKKSPVEMQQEGASSIEDYLDDAVLPEVARKIKQGVDMIAKLKNSGGSVTASSYDFITDRDEKGDPKKPEVVEVPRIASDEDMDLDDIDIAALVDSGDIEECPGCGALNAYSWNYVNHAPLADVDVEDRWTEDDRIYHIPAASGFEWQCGNCGNSWTEEDSPINHPAYTHRDASAKNGDPLFATPKRGSMKNAAPVTQMPAPAKADKPSADINQLSSDTLAKMQKALAGSEDLMNDKAAQAFIAAIAETLMNRPVETEAPEAPAAPAAAPLPIAAAFKGLSIAAAEGSEEESKVANAQSAFFVQDGNTGSIFEDGGRTPEIAEAHSKQDDKTGISRPATELPSKFAVDMTTGKALKLVQRLGDDLKKLYLEAKAVTAILDTRPVREAVESIYRSYDMMGEAAKVLNKQNMQEEAEEKAVEVKNKKKSSGKNDSIFTKKEPKEWDELAEKKKNGEPPVFHKKEEKTGSSFLGLSIAAADAEECSKGHELCENCGGCHTCNGGDCD